MILVGEDSALRLAVKPAGLFQTQTAIAHSGCRGGRTARDFEVFLGSGPLLENGRRDDAYLVSGKPGAIPAHRTLMLVPVTMGYRETCERSQL